MSRPTTLLALLALASVLAFPITTLASSSHSRPDVIEPMAGPADTTDWLIVNDVDAFENGKLTFCAERNKGMLDRHCIAHGTLTPQEALAKLAPAGSHLTGISPRMDGYGRMLGVVLYYKK